MRQTLLLLLCFALAVPAAEATTASLHADHQRLPPGSEARLLLRVVPPPGWHVYWRNPGDSGLPTRIRWTLPAGVTAGAPIWPVPQRFEESGLVTFGYAGELLLEIPLRLAEDLPEGPLQLAALVDWLACREACIPGRTALALELQVGSPALADPETGILLGRARASQPLAHAPWRVTAQVQSTRLVLDLHPLHADSPLPERLRFIPATEGIIELAAAQHWRAGPLPQLVLERASGGDLPAVLEGLLVAGEDGLGPAWPVAVPLASPDEP